MRHLEDDGSHIWLRQAATFTVEGQTRTVEIAVPLRPGAGAEEIEALLREADAGMERLSRHLDARVAALSGGASTAEVGALADMAEPVSAAPADSPAITIAETPARPAATPSPTRTPAAAPPPAATAPVRETPDASRARPSGPPPTSPAAARPASTPSAPPPATPSTVTASAEPLGIADFLAAVRREFDYNPKQAMEHLNVRSLSGLNLREALEMLRRQSLRDGGAATEPEPPELSAPAATATAKAAPARVAPSARSAPAPTPAATTPDEPRYFEEEDDEPEMAFGLPDEDGVHEELGGYGALDGEPGDLEDELGEFDDDELEDVPDFAAPPPPARRTASARAGDAAAPPATQSATAGSIAGGEGRSRAMQIVGQLRGARAGGTPSAQQRTAYRNVVTNELGEARARALAQGVYRVAPDRLGPEQYDALISWGKRDTFAEEVDAVLAALRAERASGAASTPNGAASTPAPAAPAQPPRSVNSTGATPRSGARGQSRSEGR